MGVSEAPRTLSVTMNQQLKDGDWSVWQLCPLTHPLHTSTDPRDLPAVPSWRQQQALVGTDGMGWIRIPAGTQRGHSGQGWGSTSPPWVPRAQLRSLETPAGALGAAVAGRRQSPAQAVGWLRGKGLVPGNPTSLALPCNPQPTPPQLHPAPPRAAPLGLRESQPSQGTPACGSWECNRARPGEKQTYSINLLSLGMINTLWLLERRVSGVGTDTAQLISTDFPGPSHPTPKLITQYLTIFLKTQALEVQNFISFYTSSI